MPRNLYVRTCVKFTFANKIEAVHKWSLVSVKPRSTSCLCSARFVFYSRDQNLRASGCVQTDATLLTNISQHCWMLHVASVCTSCCMLLDVVAQSLKPVKLLPSCKRTQHCWLTTPNIVGSCCARLHVALRFVAKNASVEINLNCHFSPVTMSAN